MDFGSLVTWQFMVFSLSIAAIVYVLRNLLEAFPKIKNSKTWRDRILPSLPILLGSFIGLIAVKFPYPNMINSTSGRVMFGLVAGFLSGYLYRVIKSFLEGKITKSPTSAPTSNSSPPSAPASIQAVETKAVESKSEELSKPEQK